MRVQFEFTQDDLLDAAKRFQARSKVARSWRWKDLFLGATLTWVIIFLFFIKTPLKAAIFASFVTVVTALIFPTVYKRGVDKRMRNLIKEKFADANSFICEVELTPAGFWTRQTNQQTLSEWASVAEVVVTDDSVDIFTRPGGGVIVRMRAFASMDEQRQFVELANNYVNNARSLQA